MAQRAFLNNFLSRDVIDLKLKELISYQLEFCNF